MKHQTDFQKRGSYQRLPAMCVACPTVSGQSRGCGLCPKTHYCPFILVTEPQCTNPGQSKSILVTPLLLPVTGQRWARDPILPMERNTPNFLGKVFILEENSRRHPPLGITTSTKLNQASLGTSQWAGGEVGVWGCLSPWIKQPRGSFLGVFLYKVTNYTYS